MLIKCCTCKAVRIKKPAFLGLPMVSSRFYIMLRGTAFLWRSVKTRLLLEEQSDLCACPPNFSFQTSLDAYTRQWIIKNWWTTVARCGYSRSSVPLDERGDLDEMKERQSFASCGGCSLARESTQTSLLPSLAPTFTWFKIAVLPLCAYHELATQTPVWPMMVLFHFNGMLFFPLYFATFIEQPWTVSGQGLWKRI